VPGRGRLQRQVALLTLLHLPRLAIRQFIVRSSILSSLTPKEAEAQSPCARNAGSLSFLYDLNHARIRKVDPPDPLGCQVDA
jgi:hypothetical protein